MDHFLLYTLYSYISSDIIMIMSKNRTQVTEIYNETAEKILDLRTEKQKD